MKKAFWLLLVFTLTWTVVQYWPITVHVKGSIPSEDYIIRMPLKDKKRLEYFFQNTCFLGVWSYTLIGSKPVSVHQYTKPWVAFQKVFKYIVNITKESYSLPSFREFCYLMNPEQVKMKLGWDTLNKYITPSPSSRFALFDHPNNSGKAGYYAVINKESLVKIVESHIEDFHGSLENLGITQDDLYNYENLSLFLKNLTEEKLIGTVLGFGRNNAFLYEKYGNMDLSERPMVSMWLNEDDAWLEMISEKDLTTKAWTLSDLFFPRFACDPHSEETKQLKKTYQQEREKILQFYQGQDIVEATLGLLNQRINRKTDERSL